MAATQFQIPPDHILWVTAVPNKERLEEACQKAEQAGIQMARFFEPDYDLGLTAACSEPVYKKRFWPGHKSGLGDLERWSAPKGGT